MKKVTRIIIALVAISITFLVLLRPKIKNDEAALVYKVDSSYLVVLTGTRYLMAHDPISALLGKTYDETYRIVVPRIEGVVKGSEIPVEKGYYVYEGQIDFKGNRMSMNLYYDNYDDKRKDPLSWNGEYSFVLRSND